MQIGLIITVVIVLIIVGFLCIRLWCYEKQISHMKKELNFIEKEDTNYRLSSFCAVGQTEDVIRSMNYLINSRKEKEIELKKENRVYRESITSISHDIRTPLTSAKGYLQMIQKEQISPEKKKEYLKTIELRLDDLTNMLNQLFEYARIEAGEMKFEPELFNATNVFTETVAMFYDDFLAKNCEPEVTITEKPCKMNTDKQAFVRILENLIKNALIHGVGGYQISLRKEGNYCVIHCSNLTDSLEPTDMEKIFDRFYTTDQSRSKKNTGLGLAIVKRFAVQMGGDAVAFLEGTRFTITVKIPLWEAEV